MKPTELLPKSRLFILRELLAKSAVVPTQTPSTSSVKKAG